MFEPFGDDSKSQRLDTGDGFITICAVAHHASQARHFGQPPTVIFAFKFNRNVTPVL